jgi:carbon starvation protein CstA
VIARTERNEQLSIILSFLVGVAIPILAHRVSQPLGLQATWLPSLIAFVLFGAASYFLRSRLPSRSWAIAILIYVGVPFGTIVDAFVDSDLFNRSRNMVPFEILSWWMIALGPVIVGCMLGGLREAEARERTD